MQFGDTARICFNKQFICQVGWILTIISLWRLHDWDLLTRGKYTFCSYGFKIFWVSIESCWLMMRHALYGWRLVEITGFQYLLSLYTMTICCRGRLWVCRSIYQPSASIKKTLSISSMILKSALPADHQLIGSKFYSFLNLESVWSCILKNLLLSTRTFQKVCYRSGLPTSVDLL